MKAITLHQPYATLIAIGAKRVETRSWPTKYRGELAIHAAQAFPTELWKLTKTEPFCSVLRTAGYTSPALLPLGRVVAVARLQDCVPAPNVLTWASANERAFGLFTEGRWAWVLGAGVWRCKPPIPWRGFQRLWTVPAQLEGQLT